MCKTHPAYLNQNKGKNSCLIQINIIIIFIIIVFIERFTVQLTLKLLAQ